MTKLGASLGVVVPMQRSTDEENKTQFGDSRSKTMKVVNNLTFKMLVDLNIGFRHIPETT